MASVNKVLLIGDLGRCEKTSSYINLIESKTNADSIAVGERFVDEVRLRVMRALAALGTELTGIVSPGEEHDTSPLTAYQRAARVLHAALRALRNSGRCLKHLSACNASSGWQQRLLTSVRVAAFFHARKVDARNLP
ncbi:hypothetical protein [Azohydromonas aeria]|uniref:hypothetical protein n=1 Tax=Azohydromonas aeria TaxID=2590212 RepID=UPI0012F98361|nr:hypothetical protein [Azohydromonas aeria]